MRKWPLRLVAAVLVCAAAAAVAVIGAVYFRFISQRIYEDSTRHLQEIYGQVNRSFGAFVELLPGKDGLLHISRVAQGRVDKVEDVLAIGDEVRVKVIEVDEKGKVSLDRLDKPEVKGSSSGHDGGPKRRNPGNGNTRTRRPGDKGQGGQGHGNKPRRRHES